MSSSHSNQPNQDRLSVSSVLNVLANVCPDMDPERLATIRDALQATAAVAPLVPMNTQLVVDLDLETLLTTFSLTYSDRVTNYTLHNFWDPNHDIDSNYPDPNVNLVESYLIQEALPHLNRWLYIYDEIGVRRSENIRRMPTDQVLLEAIAIMNGHAKNSARHHRKYTEFSSKAIPATHSQRRPPTNPRRPEPPEIPHIPLQLFADLYLSLTLPPLPPAASSQSHDGVQVTPAPDGATSKPSPAMKVFTGRFKYAVGIQEFDRQEAGKSSANSSTAKPRFAALVVIIEATHQYGILEARQQLLASVGCLYYARRTSGKRLDCTSYGIATDGYRWIFLKITHNGVVQFTREKDVRFVGWKPILLTIIIVLNLASELQKPGNCAEFGKGDQLDSTSAQVRTVIRPSANPDDSDWLSEGVQAI